MGKPNDRNYTEQQKDMAEGIVNAIFNRIHRIVCQDYKTLLLQGEVAELGVLSDILWQFHAVAIQPEDDEDMNHIYDPDKQEFVKEPM